MLNWDAVEILATTMLTLPTLGALALFTTYFDTGRNLSMVADAFIDELFAFKLFVAGRT